MRSQEEITEVNRGNLLPLMEHFYTIQGEGFHSGEAAYFIRLGGCTVGCHWCDVKESWEGLNHPLLSVKSIADLTNHSKSNFVVITGGEPVTYNLKPLTEQLKSFGKVIALETSGAFPFTGSFDWVCLSPKKNKPPLPEYYNLAHELKVVIYNKDDFKWAEMHKSKVSKACKLYLQVEWSVSEKMMPLIVEYVKNNPEWRISVQSHKYIDVP
jgi:organic radical activating enzyme